MSDDNDDLDAFARLFGATPETPPEGLVPPVEAKQAPPTVAPAPGSPADPLAWLLSDGPATTAFPAADAFPTARSYPSDPFAPASASSLAAFPNTTTVFPSAPAPADPTQVLPTRRSIAAEAAGAAGDSGRRNLIILGSVGAVVLILIVVLILVLIEKSGGSGPPNALSTQSGLPSQPTSQTPRASATATPTPTPTSTPTPTPTPTPTAAQAQAVAPPPPSPPTVSATVLTSNQPTCASGGMTTFAITYTSANAETLTLTESDNSNVRNITPQPSGTITAVPYLCGSNATYTLTVHSPAEGVAPAAATVTPTS